MIQDIRDAARSLAKTPRFLVIASLTLALGIGAVTAIFSVVNGVLLAPLPYPDAERLVSVRSTAPGLGYDRFGLSPDIYLYYQRHNTVFDDMALHVSGRVNLTEAGAPEVISALTTSSGYFTTLGVTFAQGRSYTADEDAPDAPPTAVISHRLWTRRYGGDPTLVGRTIRIDGQQTTVVGVAPQLMDGTDTPDIWLPARLDPNDPPTGEFRWSVVARLKDGVRPDQAASHLEPIVDRAMRDYIQSENYRAFLRDGRYRPLVLPMKEEIIGSVREPLWILLGTVGMVLLVACGNVANLCLIRAESRQREVAVRAALGAGRTGLVRKLLVEALLLASFGAALGVLVAWMALPLLLQLAPGILPRLDAVRVDGTVLAVAAGTAVLSALMFGLVPAIRYTRPQVLTMLRHCGRSATDGPSRQRGRQALVVLQTAMALVLLVGSGLLARSFVRLMDADLGFSPEQTLTFRLTLPATAYATPEEVVRVAHQLEDRLGELPGVEVAGVTTDLPVVGGGTGTAFEFEGQPIEPGRLPPMVYFTTVTADYLRALRIHVLQGSTFDSGDYREESRNVLVNRAVAERFWPGQDPIGRRFRSSGSAGAQYVVKGVIADVRHNGLREPGRPLIYFPLAVRETTAPRNLSFVLRGPAAELQADEARRAVWSINPELPLAAVRTMEDVVREPMAQFTFTLTTLGIAAVVALFLGAVGLYGVQSYAVSLRTREIGVRMALGAQPSRVQRSVLVDSAIVTGVGLLIGTVGAIALTRLLQGLLYETRPMDPLTFAGMSALLFAVAVLASYLPARRAASISPLEAMRGE